MLRFAPRVMEKHSLAHVQERVYRANLAIIRAAIGEDDVDAVTPEHFHVVLHGLLLRRTVDMDAITDNAVVDLHVVSANEIVETLDYLRRDAAALIEVARRCALTTEKCARIVVVSYFRATPLTSYHDIESLL